MSWSNNIINTTILACWAVLPLTGTAQAQAPDFILYTDQDGLSSNSVTCILQDSQGFMWFGSEDGLNRYDGYDFVLIGNQDHLSGGLSSQYIKALAEDRFGQLWIGTNRYLHRLDLRTGVITNIEDLGSDGISHHGLYIDTKDRLWASTNSGQVLVGPLGQETMEFSTYQTGNILLNGKQVQLSKQRLFEDLNGVLWFCNAQGILIHDISDGQGPRPVESGPFGLQELKNKKIWCMAQSPDGTYYAVMNKALVQFSKTAILNKWDIRGGHRDSDITIDKVNIWVSQDDGVLRIHLPTNMVLDQFKNDNRQDPDLLLGAVSFLNKDDQGRIWICGTNGLFCHDPFKKKFETVRFTDDNNRRLMNRVRSIGGFGPNEVWIGTDASGIRKYNLSTRNYQTFGNDDNPVPFRNRPIWSILVDNSGVVWAGGHYSSDILFFPPGQTKFKFFSQAGFKFTERIGAVAKGPNDEIWIGGYRTLSRLDPKKETSESFDLKSLNPEITLHSTRCMVIGPEQSIWLGTEGGGIYFFKYNGPDNLPEMEQYEFEPGTQNAPGRDWVNTLCYGLGDKLWIGTYGGGLSRFDPETKTTETFTESDGLANNVVYGIQQDGQGRLWMSTNRGISMFDPNTKRFRNFDVSDGLQSLEFNSGAHYKNEQGRMFFGGVNGWNHFHPDEVILNDSDPQVVFTDFQIANQSLSVAEGSPLSRTIEYTTELTLAPTVSVFSFAFSALNFTNAHKNKYKYILEGYDDEWQLIGTRRFITFTNLAPGDYTLRVMGTNNDGKWSSHEASLALTIQPFWYQTIWFYAICAVLAISLILLIYFLKVRHVRSLHAREKEITQRVHEEKIDKLIDLRAYTIRSLTHSIKSPLTTIGLASDAIGTSHVLSEKELRSTKRINRSIERITRRLDHLNTAAALDQGFKGSEKGIVNIRTMMLELAETLRPQVEHNGMLLETDIPDRSILASIDRSQIEMALENLLDNAVKYNSTGTTINLGMSWEGGPEESGVLQFMVSDNGVGIPNEEREKVLAFGYRSRANSDHEVPGSGIGLYHVVQVAKAHDGALDLDCPENGGTIFTITIPIDRTSVSLSPEIGTESVDARPAQLETVTSSRSTTEGAPLLLLVDDEKELLQSLEEALNSDYRIVTANNGQEGLDLARSRTPDLVLTDVNMPIMSGFELCEKLKADNDTSHIPVIMLTALSDDEKKLKGLSVGADDFIGKPFSIKELTLRIKNLLALKSAFRENLLNKMDSSGAEDQPIEPNSTLSTASKARHLILEHIQDDQFGVEAMSRLLNISRKTLERKLAKELNMTPNNLIKEVRLMLAKRMLEEKGELQIAQVGENAGFSTPQKFSRDFTAYFGMNPSDYKQHWSKLG